MKLGVGRRQRGSCPLLPCLSVQLHCGGRGKGRGGELTTINSGGAAVY